VDNGRVCVFELRPLPSRIVVLEGYISTHFGATEVAYNQHIIKQLDIKKQNTNGKKSKTIIYNKYKKIKIYNILVYKHRI